jgi:hypothetical protein
MHAQGDIETPAGQLPSHVRIGSGASGFIEGDKLHVRYVAQQGCFGFADEPGDAGVGPVILKVANDSKRMAGVANRRESDDANVFGRRIFEQVRQVDNRGRIR